MTDLIAAEQTLLKDLLNTSDRERQSAIKRQITRINEEMESLDS